MHSPATVPRSSMRGASVEEGPLACMARNVISESRSGPMGYVATKNRATCTGVSTCHAQKSIADGGYSRHSVSGSHIMCPQLVKKPGPPPLHHLMVCSSTAGVFKTSQPFISTGYSELCQSTHLIGLLMLSVLQTTHDWNTKLWTVCKQ